MKTIYFILSFLVYHTLFAQDPQLFDATWYVRTVQLDDMAPIHNVAEIDPPIAPYLDIANDFSFIGQGACNSFSGTYSFFPPQDLMATDFTATTDDCGISEHNDFEVDYFWFMSHDFWFNISLDGTVLTLGTPLGGTVVFKNLLLFPISRRIVLAFIPTPPKTNSLLPHKTLQKT